MNTTISRRHAILGGVAAVAASSVATRSARAQDKIGKSKAKFRYCLNTSTISGQKLSLVEQIEVTKKAGYDGIEVWIRDIQKHVESGGKLSDVRKRLRDSNLTVENAIGFASWIVDDDERRKKGLELARRDMGWVAELGGSRIAAPPAGAHRAERIDLDVIAERYAALIKLGRAMKVQPLLEIWGPSTNLSRLSELAYVAVACGQPDVSVLPDIYHIYRGGSKFDSLRLFSGAAIDVLHMNDYPDRPREKLTDADRVYPGDGAAPLKGVLSGLAAVGFRGVLSLELFNRDYWKQDALVVAKTGLAKMRASVAAAI